MDQKINKGENKPMKDSHKQSGFAVIELVLVIVAVAAIAGIGFWVFQQRSKTASNSEATPTVVDKKQQSQQLANEVKNEASDENKIDDQQASADKNQINADESSTDQIGGNIDATE
jgi:uncharacterized protein HemX